MTNKNIVNTNNNIITTIYPTSNSSITISDRLQNPSNNAELVALKHQISYSINGTQIAQNCTRVILDRDSLNWIKLFDGGQVRGNWFYSNKFPANYGYNVSEIGFNWSEKGQFEFNLNDKLSSATKSDDSEFKNFNYETVASIAGTGKLSGSEALTSVLLMILSTNLIPFLGIQMALSFRNYFTKRWLVLHIVIMCLLVPIGLIGFLIQVSLSKTQGVYYSKLKFVGIAGIFVYLIELIIGLLISKLKKFRFLVTIHKLIAYILFLMGPICTIIILTQFNLEILVNQLVLILFGVVLTLELILICFPKFSNLFKFDDNEKIVDNLNLVD